MTKKTYFKGKKISAKPKKYVFAGFDESTMDNTQLLNTIYNPNYYGNQQAVDTTATKENIAQNVQLGQTAAMNIQGAQQSTSDAMARLQQVKTDAEAAEKQQLSEMNEASKKQTVTSAGTSLITGLGEIGKKFVTPAAAKATTTIAGTSIPKTMLIPGGKFGVNKTVQLTGAQVGKQVGKELGKEAGKQGLKTALGSTTWANPSAGNVAAGVGLAASIGGTLWDNLSEDDDPYTYSKKEKWGDWGGNILSEVGTYGGLGSMFGPLGTVVGGVAGLGVGIFKAARESKQNKKVAQEMSAERDKQQAEYRKQMDAYQANLAKQQRIYDYNKAKIQENIVMGEEQLRQNRLQGLTESQLSGNTAIAMTGGGRKYFGKGGMSVPGGQVVPIGQGAVEFVGRKHAQGGIKLDAKTEVEGGETMDKVKMKNGKMNDYFFSEFLKYKGKSFAKHHKELVKKRASQKEIQALAKKQEAMANRRGEKDRSPKQVAEYGGLRKYQTAGFETADAVKEEDGVYRVRDAQGNILAESSDKNVAEKKAQDAVIAASKTTQVANTQTTGEVDGAPYRIPVGPVAEEISGPPYRTAVGPLAEESATVTDIPAMPDNTGTRFIDPKAVSSPPYRDLTGPRAVEEAAEPSMENSPYFQKVMANYKKEMSSDNTPAAKERAKKQAEEEAKKKAEEEAKRKKEAESKGTEEKKYAPMYTEQQLKNARRLATLGFVSQLGAPIASLAMKPKLVDAPQAITPQLLDASMAARSMPQMVSAGSIAAPRLGRVAPETEPILDRDTANRQFFANMGDPSSMVAMLASTSKTNEAERQAIADAQRTNVELAGREGMLKMDASKANQSANLEAQMANQRSVSDAQSRYLNVLSQNQNAQNQAYIANLENQTRVNLANAQLRADKQNRDITALSVMGSNIAGGVGDLFSYSIEDAKARAASGDTGVYGANFLNIFGTPKPKKTGGVKNKMYGGTNSYTSRLGDLKFKRALKAK